MSDFETLVRDMIKNGTSAEDIAKKTSDILNTINKENSKEVSRQSVINKYATQYNQACLKKNITVEDIAALCVQTVAPNHPEWDAKDIDSFYTSMIACINSTAGMIAKTPTQILSQLLNDLPDCFSNKSKKEKKAAKPAGKPNDFTTSSTGSMTLTTPEKMLLKFIDSL